MLYKLAASLKAMGHQTHQDPRENHNWLLVNVGTDREPSPWALVKAQLGEPQELVTSDKRGLWEAKIKEWDLGGSDVEDGSEKIGQ